MDILKFQILYAALFIIIFLKLMQARAHFRIFWFMLAQMNCDVTSLDVTFIPGCARS